MTESPRDCQRLFGLNYAAMGVLSSTEGGLDIDLHGDLAGILSLATAKKGADQGPDLQQVKMVAGAGFEPATFRL